MPQRTLVAPGATLGLQQVGGVSIPWPYELWSDGVYLRGAKATVATPDADTPLPQGFNAHRRRVSFRALWLSGLGHTVDTQEPLVQLSYLTVNGQQQSIWLSRAQITDHQKLAALGAQGLPLDSVSAKEALTYLRAQESLNGPNLPMLHVGHRSGPYRIDDKLGWLIGKQWIGEGVVHADPRVNQRHVVAYSPQGDAQAWLNKWRELRDVSWVCRFLIASTFAPPLLRFVKCRTFIVHHWGDSSHGKTATAVFALSAWGHPELLYSSLNRTAISITEVFRHVTELPVLYDEKQVATVTSEELIYSICTGTGRERGAKDGGLRQDKPTWLTIARTTGEVPLVTSADVGGQFNRVLQIHSKAFQDRRHAESVYPFTAEHHGHAGPAFLRELHRLVNAPGGEEFITQLYRELREALINRIGMDSNHCAYGAVIAAAQTLSEFWLLGIDPVEAKERALDDATNAIRETAPRKQPSYAEKALSKLRDHWIANPLNYVDASTKEGKERADRVYHMSGIETEWGMAFIPHEADDILMKANYEPTRVWRDFDNNGWLVNDGQNQLTTMTLRNGKSLDHPVYLIKHNIFFSDAARQTRLRVINGGNTSPLGT